MRYNCSFFQKKGNTGQAHFQEPDHHSQEDHGPTAPGQPLRPGTQVRGRVDEAGGALGHRSEPDPGKNAAVGFNGGQRSGSGRMGAKQMRMAASDDLPDLP